MFDVSHYGSFCLLARLKLFPRMPAGLVGLEDPVYSSRADSAFPRSAPGISAWRGRGCRHWFSVTGRESSDEGFVLIWPRAADMTPPRSFFCFESGQQV